MEKTRSVEEEMEGKLFISRQSRHIFFEIIMIKVLFHVDAPYKCVPCSAHVDAPYKCVPRSAHVDAPYKRVPRSAHVDAP